MTDSSPESLHPRHATRPHKRILAWLKQRQSRVLLWLRLIVSVILMALVVSLVLDNRDKLHDVNWNWIPLAWLLMLTSTLFKALRWSLLVRLSHMQLTYRRLLGTYLVGAFFSTVLPTSIGGDAVRAVDTAAKRAASPIPTSSVLIERGIGLLVVIGSGSIFGLFIEAGKVPTVFLVVVHGMFIGGVIGLALLRQGWFIEPIAALMSRLKMGRLVDKVRHLQAALSGHLGHPWVLVQMLLLSIVANTLTIGATYLVLSAVTEPIALASFVPMITLITVAELIPISIAALGVKESAYIFFLGLVGVGSAEAGVTAIIMRALVWALALLGGVVYIGRTFRASPKDKTAEV